MLLKCALFALCVISCLAKFPSDIPRCRVGDLKCIAEVATEVLRKFPGGRPDLGFPAFDPYIIYNVTLKENKRSQTPINLHLFLERVEIHGISHTTFERAIGWNEWHTANNQHELLGTIPRLELRGDYRTDGKFMHMPMKGEGGIHIVLENISSVVKFKTNLVERDGLRFLKIQQIKVLLEPSDAKIKLTNLFDGNKDLEDLLITIINDNWKDAWAEAAPDILSISEPIIQSAIQGFLDRHEFDDLFLPNWAVNKMNELN